MDRTPEVFSGHPSDEVVQSWTCLMDVLKVWTCFKIWEEFEIVRPDEVKRVFGAGSLDTCIHVLPPYSCRSLLVKVWWPRWTQFRGVGTRTIWWGWHCSPGIPGESRAQGELPARKGQLQRVSGDDGLQITSNEEQLTPLPDLQVQRVKGGTEEVACDEQLMLCDLARCWGKVHLLGTPVCFGTHFPSFCGPCLVNLGLYFFGSKPWI